MRCPSGPLLLLALAGVSPASACDIPIHAYALEQWYPQPYQAVVFARGKADPALCRTIRASNANLSLVEIDVAQDVPAGYQACWEACKDEPLPRMVVRPPAKKAEAIPMWSFPFTDEAIARVLDSPARKQIAARIAAGDAAVWVLVESGNRELDDAKAQLIDDTLKASAEELTLSEEKHSAAHAGPSAPAAPAPKASPVSFSVIRIPAQGESMDSPEAMLVRMLGQCRDFVPATPTDGPRLYIVFGRGRALGSLTGADISREKIERGCSFLFGPCMCEIKESNPGVDMLIDFDWNSLFADRQANGVRPGLRGPRGPLPASPPRPVPAPVIPSATAEPVAVRAANGGRITDVRPRFSGSLLSAGALVAAGGMVLFLFRRK